MPGLSARIAFGAGAVLVVLFALLGLRCAAHYSQTYDECVHIGAGYSYLATRDFRLARSHPPFAFELQALPIWLLDRPRFEPRRQWWEHVDDRAEYMISREWMYGSTRRADRFLFLARLPALALGILTVVLTGWWAHRLWGPAAGLLALAFAALDPNLVAHASLANNDVPATALILASCYLMWEFFRNPTYSALAASGAVAGLALTSKFSCVLIVPLLGTAVAGWFLAGRGIPLPGIGPANRAGQGLAVALTLASSAAIVFPLVYLGHAFEGPRIWLEGLLGVFRHVTSGHVSFLMGEFSPTGWWYYFPVAFALKTPLGTLAAMTAAALLARRGAALGLAGALLLLLPPAAFWAAALASSLDIGFRHVLPALPFMLILVGRLATVEFASARVRAAVLALPIAMTALSSAGESPDQLSYFNESVGGPSQGYRYLSDSNVDWGQDLRSLAEFFAEGRVEKPYLCYFGAMPVAYYGIDYRWLPGNSDLRAREEKPLDPWPKRDILAISAFKLQGVHPESIRGLYWWLLERRPIARIGYSIFVFDITTDAQAHERLAAAYAAFGMRRRAAEEVGRARTIEPGRAIEPQLLAWIAEAEKGR